MILFIEARLVACRLLFFQNIFVFENVFQVLFFILKLFLILIY